MGFGTTNAVNGVFLCRGDVNSTTCMNCVTTAATDITRRCPNQTESIIWYDECMLRYTNRYFAPTSIVPRVNMNNGKNISTSKLDIFNQMLGFLGGLAAEAGNSQTSKQFAVGEANFNLSGDTNKVITVYGLAQRVPGVTNVQCQDCLVNASRTLLTCCEGKQGGRALLAWCNIRYDLQRFYNQSASTPGSPSSGKNKSKSKTRTVLIVVLVTGSTILFCLGCYFFMRRSSWKKYKTLMRENFGNESSTLESLQFNLATIEAATKKFSPENKIGKGGFGEVYKGILIDGREIAVKKLSQTSGQGFCLKEQEKMLIYEYVSNKSLDYFLFDRNKSRLLHWFEHDNMNPKISDFGMARMVALDQDRGSTNRIVGTYGYISKKNARSLLSNNTDDLLSRAWRQWRDQTPLELIDQDIRESCNHNEAVKCIQIGLLCVQDKPDDRPSMANVVSYLTSTSAELPVPGEPTKSPRSGILQMAVAGELSSASISTVNEMSSSVIPSSTFSDNA
ncbi:hypothetical protein P8452_10569 [Trifolium repens]|nr:hypothetical protein P8452_10569 [Trifolium repens]